MSLTRPRPDVPSTRRGCRPRTRGGSTPRGLAFAVMQHRREAASSLPLERGAYCRLASAIGALVLVHACGGQASAPGGSAGAGGGDEGNEGAAAAGGTSANAAPRDVTPCGDEATIAGGTRRCASGRVHRATSEACPSQLPRPTPAPLAVGGRELIRGCEYDRDCTEAPLGYCAFGRRATYCAYGCLTDADCEPGLVCSCGEEFGVCAVTACAIDSDCGAFQCAQYESPVGPSLACTTALDECGVDADCADGERCQPSGGNPLADIAGSWICQSAPP